MSACPFADLSDPDLHRGGVPADLYRQLRAARSISVPEPIRGGQGFHAFFLQQDIDHISKCPQKFSSSIGSAFLNDPPAEQLPILRTMILNAGGNAGAPPPVHQPRR